jgi:hypothetical protein
MHMMPQLDFIAFIGENVYMFLTVFWLVFTIVFVGVPNIYRTLMYRKKKKNFCEKERQVM